MAPRGTRIVFFSLRLFKSTSSSRIEFADFLYALPECLLAAISDGGAKDPIRLGDDFLGKDKSPFVREFSSS